MYTPEHLNAAFAYAWDSDDQLPDLADLDRDYQHRAGLGDIVSAYRAGVDAALIAVCGFSLPTLRAQAQEASES